MSLKAVHEALAQDWQRLQEAWAAPDLHQSTTQQLATLCTTLSEVSFGNAGPTAICVHIMPICYESQSLPAQRLCLFLLTGQVEHVVICQLTPANRDGGGNESHNACYVKMW